MARHESYNLSIYCGAVFLWTHILAISQIQGLLQRYFNESLHSLVSTSSIVIVRVGPERKKAAPSTPCQNRSRGNRRCLQNVTRLMFLVVFVVITKTRLNARSHTLSASRSGFSLSRQVGLLQDCLNDGIYVMVQGSRRKRFGLSALSLFTLCALCPLWRCSFETLGGELIAEGTLPFALRLWAELAIGNGVDSSLDIFNRRQLRYYNPCGLGCMQGPAEPGGCKHHSRNSNRQAYTANKLETYGQYVFQRLHESGGVEG